MSNCRSRPGFFQCALYFSAGLCACSASDGSSQDGGGAPDPALATTGQEGDQDPPDGQPLAAPSAETRALRLRFEARVGGEPFSCGSTYLSSAGVRFTPADLRLFVQDLALITADGVEQAVTLDVRPPWQLEQVALLDFEDASGACLAGTSALNLELFGSVPGGDYRGLAFTNGVPEVDNHADPTRLPPPLQAGSMSWGWLLGYRFLMAEVAEVGAPADAAGVADAAPLGSALLHLGSTACSGNPSVEGIVCARPNRNRVRLAEFDPDLDVVVVDVAALFDGIDLRQVTTCHSSGEECAPFFERVGIDWVDGAATDGQALYRARRTTTAAP
jgi:uncharacterized repeat protein (TIGR04052 family)